MKKVLSLLLAAGMILACVACGEQTANDDTTTAAATTTTLAGTTDSAASAGNGETTVPTAQQGGVSTTLQQGGQTNSQVTTKPQTTTTAKPYKTKYYPRYQQFITVRDGLKNVAYKLNVDQEITLGFMGGSVTQGMGDDKGFGGWRGRIATDLKTDTRYSALVSSVNCALGGNGSQYGTYAVDEFIASQKPDLVFVEYAINNAHDGYTDPVFLWSHYETIIHKIRAANPYADIVLVYANCQDGCSTPVIPEIEKIADYYKLPSVNFNELVNYKLQNGYSWNYYYSDDAHPNAAGYKMMTEAIHGLIETAMVNPTNTYTKIAMPAVKTAYLKKNAKMVMTSKLSTLPNGWKKADKFPQNNFGGCIQSTDATKTMTIKFKGTDFGILLAFGEDYGVIEYQIDNQTAKQIDCYKTFDNPEARILYENGVDGEHTVKLRLAKSGDPVSVAALFVNGTIISVQ